MGLLEGSYEAIKEEEICKTVASLREIFNAGVTLGYSHRLEQLQSLRKMLIQNEDKIVSAVQKDLGKKSPFEAHCSEFASVLHEVTYAIDNLKTWMKPNSAYSPVALQPSSSYTSYEPLGVVLIISPWNYPINLALIPLIGAIAAGNCVFLKLSRHASESAKTLLALLPMFLDMEILAMDAFGGSSYITQLLTCKWDHIFFTGSSSVGRVVYQAAAKFLTPCTLELGGKNPVIVDSTTNLPVACRRIAWAKFINCGQTCLGADIAYVHEDIMGEFVATMISTIREFYGTDAQKSHSYARIISKEHTERLSKLLQDGTIVSGGIADLRDKYLSPTIMMDVQADSPLLKEEIFGPILPICSFSEVTDLLKYLKTLPSPLAVYCFTTNNSFAELCRIHTKSGAFLQNEAIMHFLNSNLPFGGVGESGFGRYHGKRTFITFSNERALVKNNTKSFLDVPVRYPPYETEKGANTFKFSLASMFTKSQW